MEKRHSILFGILFLTTALIWALSLWSRTEILRLNRSILQRESELLLLREEEKRLESLCYRPIDLSESEKAAHSLGMDRPRREQLVSTETVLPDRITVHEPEKTLIDRLREQFPYF